MNTRKRIIGVEILLLIVTFMFLFSSAQASGITIQGEGASIQGDISYAPYHTIIPCEATNGVGRLWYKESGFLGKFQAIVLHVYFTWLSHAGAVETCP